jgi:8-oxo-dGTP pyrophosphatase MutT (NUDIX family)
MVHPVPSAPKRTPLPSAIGAHVAPTGASFAAQLPTVEEISAGGVVVDKHDGGLRVAIIARLNRGGRLEWCLPKGHPEGVETHAEAAVREIEEETGISGVVLAPLGSIDYWFTVSGHRVHKTVHHFLLRATGGFLTIENDPDHEAVDVAWVPLNDLGRRLSFPNERRIADLARDVLPADF